MFNDTSSTSRLYKFLLETEEFVKTIDRLSYARENNNRENLLNVISVLSRKGKSSTCNRLSTLFFMDLSQLKKRMINIL